MNRRVPLAVGLCAVVLAAAMGWLAGRQVRSPAEVAARTAAPEPSPIVIPVERTRLQSEVITRGTVGYGSPLSVSLPASALKKGTAVVTRPPERGVSLAEGSVAMAVSGRPVLVLEGALPAHRDLGPGAVGEDVRQLEAGLLRLGFDPGPVDGIYDPATAGAVGAWYATSGWAPFGPTEEQLVAARAAGADLSGAQESLVGAQEAVVSSRAALAAATDRVRAAQTALQDAPAAEAAEWARWHRERLAATADVANRRAALQAAIDAENVARLRLAEARGGPPLPPSELAALHAAVRQAASAVQAASADLAAASAASAAVSPPPPPGGSRAQAEREVAAALDEQARAAEAVDLSRQRAAIVAGRIDARAVAELSGRLGVQVPADEVLFFPGLPVRVDEARVKAGEQPAGPVMTVTSSRLVVNAAVTLDDARLVRRGSPVTIQERDLGLRATGTVTEVADTPGTRGVDPQRFYLGVTPAEAPAALAGASVVLSITVQATEAEVLAVPVSALSVSADGSSRIQVRGRDDLMRFVTVRPGLVARGLVEVVPMGADLSPGDLVVVGSAGTPGTPASKGANRGP